MAGLRVSDERWMRERRKKQQIRLHGEGWGLIAKILEHMLRNLDVHSLWMWRESVSLSRESQDAE